MFLLQKAFITTFCSCSFFFFLQWSTVCFSFYALLFFHLSVSFSSHLLILIFLFPCFLSYISSYVMKLHSLILTPPLPSFHLPRLSPHSDVSPPSASLSVSFSSPSYPPDPVSLISCVSVPNLLVFVCRHGLCKEPQMKRLEHNKRSSSPHLFMLPSYMRCSR